MLIKLLNLAKEKLAKGQLYDKVEEIDDEKDEISNNYILSKSNAEPQV